MKQVADWRGIAAAVKGASVALGNFDGVHRGHQRVIALAAEAARTAGKPLGVISFEPHPRRWFQPDAQPFRLMTVSQQARALSDMGVEAIGLPTLAGGAVAADLVAGCRSVAAVGPAPCRAGLIPK